MKYSADKISFIKEICSMIVFETKYKKGFFRIRKKAYLKIWFTKTKIYIIEVVDSKGNDIIDYTPFEYNFKQGDSINKVFEWSEESGYKAEYILYRGKGRGKYQS